MTNQSDPIRAVAETVDAEGNLRWPGLSRVPECGCDYEDGRACSDKVVGGRVPDVTLENFEQIVDTIKLDKYCDGWQCWITIEGNDAVYEGYGFAEYDGGSLTDLMRKAACAALLASIE